MKEYSIDEIFPMLGLQSAQTLRNWEQRLNIKIKRNSKGSRRYTDKDIELFKKVKEFLDSGLSYIEIQKELNLSSIEDQISNDNNSENNLDIEVLKTDISNHIENRFEKFLEISQSLASTSYKLGSLETDNKNLLEKLQEAQNSFNRVQKDIDNKNKEIIKIKEDMQKLRDTFELNLKEKDQEIYKLLAEIKEKDFKINEVNLNYIEAQKNLKELKIKVDKFNELGFWSKSSFKFE